MGSAARAGESRRRRRGEGRRRWRALDLGSIRAFLEAHSPRVRCAQHGVVVARVPWAGHGAGHTYAVDDTCSWLVTHCSKSAVPELLRVA
jgi:transposase